ncbi:MAG: HEAT repeat domain-containing protein [Chloroflexi bacterium]|nr:HEAT repeat domain-containing protein [Chloroflexota bacterium]
MSGDFRTQLTSLLQTLHHDNRHVLERDINEIIAARVDDLEAALSTLENNEAAPSLRIALCWVVLELDPEQALPGLIRVLTNPHHEPPVRQAAAAALNGHPAALQSLLKIARSDPDPRVRGNVIGSLAWFHDSDDVLNTLLHILREDRNQQVKLWTIHALGWLDDPRAVDPLINLLSNRKQHPELRAQAAESLALLKATGAVPALIEALYDDHADVRFWAVFALGQIGDQRALPMLERLAQRDTQRTPGWWEVGLEAAAAIQMILSRHRQ